jgi:gliding motility-associated-like protein
MKVFFRLFFIAFLIWIPAQSFAVIDIIHFSKKDVSCPGANDGWLTVDSVTTSAPTTPPYAVAFTSNVGQTFAIGDTIFNLSQQTIIIRINDDGQIFPTNQSVDIDGPDPLILDLAAIPATCFDTCDGQVFSQVQNGTPPYTYLWSNNLTATFLSDLCDGTYSVTVTDNNGCTISSSTTVIEPNQINPNITTVNVACFGESTGSATSNPINGTAPLTYSWSTGTSGANNTEGGLTQGSYDLTVTDADGCQSIEAFTISEPTALITSSNKSDPFCNGESNGFMNTSVSGGTIPYTFDWNDIGVSSQNRPALSEGTYTVTISDNNGCTSIETQTLIEPQATTNVISGTNILCFGESTGDISISVTGGTPGNTTFDWSDNSNSSDNSDPYTSSISNLPAGKYYVTITNSLGCTQLDSLTLTEPTDLLPSFTNETSPSCNGGSDGTITASATGGVAPYTFNWPGNANTNPLTGLSNGTYTVTVVDANSCTKTLTSTLVEPVAIVPTLTPSDVLCNGGSDGSISASANGGNVPYTFNWPGNPNTNPLTNLTAGTYTVTVVDASGCSVTSSATVGQPASGISIGLSKSDVFCFGIANGSITTTVNGGTSPYTFVWNDGPITQNRSFILDGTYTITVTDNNACTASNSITVGSVNEIMVTMTGENVNCSGGNDGKAYVTYNSGGVAPVNSFAWSNGGTSDTISNLIANKYFVTITDIVGCQKVDSITITEPTQLVIDPPTIVHPLCNQDPSGTINLNVSGGTPNYTYLWNDNDPNQNRANLIAGNYTVTITDANGCSNSVSATLVDPTVLSITIDSLEDASCNGFTDGFARALATGGTGAYTYAWQGGPSTAANPNLGVGTYTVTVTDNNGCTTSTSATITAPSSVIANASVVSDASCDGLDDGEVTANGSGGTAPYTYIWNPGLVSSQSLTNLAGGSYTVTVTDNNGCFISETVTINQPTAIAFTTSGTDLLCNNDNSGIASVVNPTGGTSPYTYFWTPGGSTNQVATGLSAQSYTVLVTDNNGCTNTGSVILGEPITLTANITSSTQPTCNGISDGTATVTALGGTIAGNYTYLWSPDGETTATISNKGAGTYDVTVTDDNACIATDQVIFTNPTSVVIITDSISMVNCFGGSDGYIGLSANSGIAPYTFDWSNIVGSNDGATNPSLTQGTYDVTVTDANGCFETQSFNISQPVTAFTVAIVEVKKPCTGASDGSLTVTESNGTAPYTYNWSNTAQTTDTITGLSVTFPGQTYQVTVTDDNGCTATNSIFLSPSAPITIFGATGTDNLCFGESSGSAVALAGGGTGTLTYNWSNNQSGFLQSNLTSGTYTVTIIDDNSCFETRTVTINEPNQLDPGLIVSDETCSGNSDGSATSTPIGGTAPYDFVWSNSTPASTGLTATSSSLAAGTYTLTITDANNCDSVEVFTVNANLISYTYTDSLVNESCNGLCDGYIEIKNFSGGVAPVTFSWSDGQIGQIRPNLCSGNYTVTISDANGCDSIQSYTIAPGNIVLANLSSTDASCGQNNGSATTTPTGGVAPYTFNWSNGTPQVIAVTSSINNLSAGAYDVTITDNGGCIIITPFTINAISGLTFDTTVTHILGCNGDCTGSIILTNTAGGTAPYNYTWSNGSSADNIQNLCAGNYSVTISDANSCDTIQSFTIIEPSQLNPIFSKIDASCGGIADGSITSTPTGGTPPYIFNWSNSTPTSTGITATSSSLLGGSYTLTVTDANGCDSIQVININSGNINYTYTDSIVSESCLGACDGFIEIKNLAGGVPPISYLWSNSATSTSISNLCPGNYSVTISDANGCDSIASFTINPGNSVIANLTSTNASCGVSNGSVITTPVGGTTPYSFNWMATTGIPNSTGISATAGSLSGGSYDVTITDAIGCSIVEPFTIGNVAGFTFDTSSTNVLGCFGECTGNIVISNLLGGTTPYVFTWNSVVGTNNMQNLCAGTYTLNISDANACDTNLTFIISQPSLVEPGLTINNASCSGATNGTATSTPTGGSAPYNFQWITGQVFIGTTSSITEPAGNYSLTVTDANGCDTIQSFTIGGAGSIYSYTDSVEMMSCNGACDGYIEIKSLTGGLAPITYTWSNNSSITGPINPNLCAGTYTLTISDANSCDSIISYTITDPAPITASISTISDTCLSAVGSAEIVTTNGGTLPYTYNWPGGIGSGTTAPNVAAGSYNVTIEDANGCSIIEAFSITNFSTFSIVATVDSVSCKDLLDGGITISTIGGVNPVTYNWSGGLVGANPTGIRAGDYDITVTDAAGCAEISTITVNEPDSLQSNILTTNESCNPGGDGTAVAISQGGTAPYTYTWSAGTSAGNSVSDLANGNYRLTTTDKYGCSEITIFNISSDAPYVVTPTTTTASCNGGIDGTISLTVTGAVAPIVYNWAGGLPPQANQTGLPAGNYLVTVTDGTFCSSQLTIGIIEDSPIIGRVTATDESCTPGGDAYAIATQNGGLAPYTYTWSAGGTPFGDSLADLSVGAYSVTIEDANACTEVIPFSVLSGSDIDAGETIVEPLCFGECTGTISLNPTGGSGTGYTYLWDDNTNLSTRTGLCIGRYSVTISDDATPPCTKVEGFNVSTPSPLSATTFSSRSNCSGIGGGGVTFFVSGGTSPFILTSTVGSVGGLNISGLDAGGYSGTITDANGCNIIVPYTIQQAVPPILSSTVTPATCFGGNDGLITISSLGGTNPLTYNWTGGLAGANPLTTAGTFTVTVTDGKGCESTETVTVTEATQILPNFTLSGETCNPGNDGSVTANPTGGTGPYNYNWGAGIVPTNTNSSLSAGTYSVTLYDALACSEVVSYRIDNDAPFNLDSIITHITCNGLSNGEIDLTVTGNTAPVSYNWSVSPTNLEDQTSLSAGLYSVTVTNQVSGCTETASFLIVEPDAITISEVITDESCSPGNDGSILVTPNGGTVASGLYSYQWDNGLPANNNQVGLPAGVYNVTVTDDNNCTATKAIVISPSAPFNLSLDSTDLSCNGVNNGTITSVTNAINPSYSWDNGLLPIANQTGLFAGTYCLTVTDDNGCTESACIVVNEPSLLANIISTTPESCTPGTDGTANASASGGIMPYTFNWPSGATSTSESNLTTGTYSVTLTDFNGCTLITPFTIGSIAPYSVILDSTDVSCNGATDGTITLTTTAINPTFNWSPAPAIPNNQNQSGLPAGIYTVIVTEPSSGCTETNSIVINEPAILNPIIVTTDENCSPGNDGTATGSAAGGTAPYTFNWPGNIQGVSIGTLTAGSYDVTITDNNGCTLIEPFTIGSNAPYTVDLDSTDVSCNGGSNGTITLTTTAINPTFDWGNGITVQNRNNLIAGTYTVTVTEPSSGCAETSIITINEPNLITTIINTSPANCSPGNDGIATALVSGGDISISGQYNISWPLGGSGTSVSNLPSGNYNVTITDDNNCTLIEPFTIGSSAVFFVGLDSTDVSCNGLSDGTITLTTSAFAPIYRWTSPLPATQNQSGLAAGTYDVTVTDASTLCTETASIIINEPSLIIPTIITTPESCSPGNDGTAFGSAIGGSSIGNYTFDWSTGQFNVNPISNLSSGSYTLTVTDGSGCTVIENFNIGSTAPFNLTLDSTDISCNGSSDGTITLITSAISPTFNWSPAPAIPTNQNQSGLSAGIYRVTVTEPSSGCAETAEITINEPSVIIPTVIVTNETCIGANGTAIVSATGGTTAIVGNYQFDWSNGLPSNALVTGLSAGNYSVTITDDNGCTIVEAVNVGSDAPYLVSLDSTDITCNGVSDGSITLTTNAINPTFLWSPSPAIPTNQNQSGLSSGVYSVTVTEPSSGCTETSTITINEPNPISLSIVKTDRSCLGPWDGTAVVIASGGTVAFDYSYLWSNGNPTASVGNLGPFNFSVTVTDDNGCTAVENIQINDAQKIIPNEIVNGESCSGACDGTIALNPTNGSGTYSYRWNTGETTQNRSGLCGGNYQVTISDGLSCDTILSFNINSNFPLITTVTTQDQSCGTLAVCDGEASITTNGGLAPYTYQWPAGTITNTAGDTASSLCIGTYVVTITDASGCSKIENFSIGGPLPISATFAVTQPTCNILNGAVTVTASGGSSAIYTYQWYDNTLTSIGTTVSINAIGSGIYYLDITDDTGCSDRFSITVSDLGSETVTISKVDASCFGVCDGQATATFTCQDPSCSIKWFNASSGVSLGITNQTATNLCAGDYYVEVINNSGCKSVEQISIGSPTEYSITETLNNVTCFNGFNGEISLSVAGGSGSINYNWSPGPITGQGTNQVTGLSAGNYFVTISDGSSCDTVLNYVITQPSEIMVSFNSIDATCNQSDGFINATVSGGTITFDYNYQWFDGSSNLLIGQVNPSINGVNAGTYFLRITDNVGCQKTFITTIGNTNSPTISIDSIRNVTCFDDNNGAIFSNATGTNGPFTYNWLPQGQTGKNISNLTAGTYTLGVTNSIGCISYDTAVVLGPTELIASISSSDASCGFCNGVARVTPSGGTAPYTYLWSNGSISDSAEALCGGVYSFVLSDATGCSKTVNFTINTDGGPTGETVTLSNASCASTCDGTATVNPIGGTAPYTYLWLHNGSTTNSISNLCAGSYILQVSDVKGCSRSVNIDITSPSAMSLTSTVVAQTCNSNPCDGSIRVDIQGGTSPYSYNWGPGSFPNSNNLNNICAGIYNLTVTDANGCTLTETMSVSNDQLIVTTTPTTNNVSCAGACDGSLISNLTIQADVFYQWYTDKGVAIGSVNTDVTGTVCAGDYYLEITTTIGSCKSYEFVSVSEPDSIKLGSSIVKNISCNGECDGEIFISTTGGNILYNYSWNDPNTQNEIPAVDLCSGTYAVTATDANGCSATTSVTLTDPPVLNLLINSSSNLICSSDCNASADVSASGGTAPYEFNWSGGQVGASPQDLCFGPNIVTLTDATGCSLTDTVFISAQDTILAIVPSQSIYCGEGNIRLLGTAIGSTVNSVAWYIGNTSTLFTNNLDTTINRTIGTYPFYLIASNGSCSDTTEFIVEVVANPIIGLAPSIAIFKDEIAAFKLSGTDISYKYLWTPSTNLTDSSIAEPLASPKETTTYTLTVTDTNNCMYVDSIKVIYTKEFNIPSGISPNGDGVNDLWEIDFLEDFPNATVAVYNRWGEILFEAKNGYTDLWDGTYKGSTLPIGTYYFIIDLKSDRFDPITGPITILK